MVFPAEQEVFPAQDQLCRCYQQCTSEERKTMVEGFDSHDVDLDRLASDLKTSLVCGGTIHEESIELQGNHRDRIADVLAESGFEVQ